MILRSEILAPLFSDSSAASIFSDENFIREMLRVEAALALVEGRLGIIPMASAEIISHAAETVEVDYGQLQVATDKAGVPVSELIRQLRLHCGQPHGEYAHWGATTQDVLDTALVLQLRDALSATIRPQLQTVIANLAALADRHRHTLMAGRTHSQQALPITFGLKAAGWLAPLLRHRQRIAEIAPRLLVVQFGGAVGTLAALGEKGPAVQRDLAAALGIGRPLVSWHTQRDTLTEFASWLSLVTASLAKMAQDIILMAQSEVAEVRESDDPTRGGSSTMPQKSNPMVSEAILAIHRTNSAHLSALHQSGVHEHERGTHGWQVEWLNLPAMVVLTAGALNKAAWLTDHLVVDTRRMRQHVTASNGLMLAEAISFALSQHMPRSEAKRTVRAAAQRALEQNRHLIDVLREQINAPLDWETLRDEANYLGSVELIIDRLIEAID